MTIYCKVINGKLVPASNNLGITGLAENAEIALAQGYTAYNEVEYALYDAGQRELLEDGSLRDITQDTNYIEDQKQNKLEVLTGQYTDDKCERMISWVATFINGITTATSLDDIKSKANTFKTKLATLQNDYTTKCTEVENG